jgi:hypothetical protein
MLVPEILFGTTDRVRRESRKVVTQLLRGKGLEEIFANVPKIDVAEHPAAYIWLDRAWAGIGE